MGVRPFWNSVQSVIRIGAFAPLNRLNKTSSEISVRGEVRNEVSKISKRLIIV